MSGEDPMRLHDWNERGSPLLVQEKKISGIVFVCVCFVGIISASFFLLVSFVFPYPISN